MTLGYYDYDGEPIDVIKWAVLFEDFPKRMVARTRVNDDIHVSTVWLGIDLNFGEGPPMIFETMIFGGDHDAWSWRYPTWGAAVAGHDQAVALAGEAVRSSR